MPAVVAFWVLFYVWIGSETFLAWRLRRSRSADAVASDARSIWVLIGSIWIGMTVGFQLAFLVPGAAFTQHRLLLFVAGMAVALAGLLFRWYSIWYLGESFTSVVATRPDQRVVNTGPYRWIRHPSYTGALLTVVGFLTCLTNPLALLGFVFPLIGYGYRIRVEEQTLVRNLGEPYRSYMGQTKRLIPFII